MVESSREDCYSLAPLLRHADELECRAVNGQGGLMGLINGWETSIGCYTAWEGTLPVAMFGVSPFVCDTWGIWMLGSDRIEARAKALLRISRQWISELRELNHLHALMDERNTVHRGFCERLGARVIATYPDHGFAREPFIHLYWSKTDV